MLPYRLRSIVHSVVFVVSSHGTDVAASISRSARPSALQWRCKLDYATYEALGSLRSEELFDVIVDYPDSSPAARSSTRKP